MTEESASMQIPQMMVALGAAARTAAAQLALCSNAERNATLQSVARLIRRRSEHIQAANQDDMRSATQKGLGAAMLDRLALDDARIEAMATGLEAIARLPDPVGRILAAWERPNGLQIQRVAVPLGVIGIIYESRPNVTADAAGLCLKSGNAVILRGGSESLRSNQVIYQCLHDGLSQAGLDPAAVQLVQTSDRDAVGYMLASMAGSIDVLIPRGGKGLVKRVQEEARIPVIGHLDGICHVYVHASADAAMAADIVVNAKMRRTGICGAAETLLVDRAAATGILPKILAALTDAGCTIKGDEDVQALFSPVEPASEEDWSTEYLDAVISCRIVDDIDQAIWHIGHYGSGHTESIVAGDAEAAAKFLAEVDSAIVLHNASTQFADGGEFGMGAEIGIATGRIHARGPVGAEQLTIYKYVVRGSGQVRP